MSTTRTLDGGAFRAVVRAVVPAAEALDESSWATVEQTVEDALASRSRRMVVQIRLFMKMLDGLSRLRYRTSLAGLDRTRTERLLERLSRNRVLALRRGVWGVRTLAYMGFYGRPAAGAALGYRASAEGWAAIGGPTAWTERQRRCGPQASTLMAGSEPHGEERSLDP